MAWYKNDADDHTTRQTESQKVQRVSLVLVLAKELLKGTSATELSRENLQSVFLRCEGLLLAGGGSGVTAELLVDEEGNAESNQHNGQDRQHHNRNSCGDDEPVVGSWKEKQSS